MPDANYSPKLVTQLSALGDTVFYLVSAKNMLIDHKAGVADDNWFTDKYGNISSILVPVIGIYATYASLPSVSSLAIGDYALVTSDHTLHRVVDTSGSKAWTASNKGVTVDGTRLFINTADSNKLVRWDGSAFSAAVAVTSGSSGSGNGITLVDVASLSSITYPNPSAW